MIVSNKDNGVKYPSFEELKQDLVFPGGISVDTLSKSVAFKVEVTGYPLNAITRKALPANEQFRLHTHTGEATKVQPTGKANLFGFGTGQSGAIYYNL